MQGVCCLPHRAGIEAQERLAEAFGDWLSRARAGQGLTQEVAAERAGVSRVQWARWEAGAGLPRRTSIPAIARAVRYANEADVYRRAGYVAPSDAIQEQEEPTEPFDEDFAPDVVDVPAFTAFLLGLPPAMQQAEYERVRALWLEHQRQMTTYGRRSTEDVGAVDKAGEAS